MRLAYQFQGQPVKSQDHQAHADTHRAPYLPSGKAYELKTWYTDGERRPASATGAVISNVKGQGYKLTSSVGPTSHLCLFLIRETKCCTCVSH